MFAAVFAWLIVAYSGTVILGAMSYHLIVHCKNRKK